LHRPLHNRAGFGWLKNRIARGSSLPDYSRFLGFPQDDVRRDSAAAVTVGG